MKQKYINKILNFSSDIIGRGEELIINREQAKGIIKELEQDYISKAEIRLEIAELKEILSHYGEYTKLNILEKTNVDILNNRIEMLQKFIGE